MPGSTSCPATPRGDPHQRQRERGRKCLREENRRLRRETPEYAPDDHAAEEEHVELTPVRPQRPEQSRGETAAIEALIGGERGGAGAPRGRPAEDPTPDRMVPEETPEDPESEVTPL